MLLRCLNFIEWYTFDKDEHLLATISQYSHYQEGSGWKQDLKMKYVQRTCYLCDYKTRLYCKCNPVFRVCQDCFLKHIDIYIYMTH